jgi:hypothetical protein
MRRYMHWPYFQTSFINPECSSLSLSSFQGLISLLVKDNGFNKDRVTKVCAILLVAIIQFSNHLSFVLLMQAIEKIKSARNKSSQGRWVSLGILYKLQSADEYIASLNWSYCPKTTNSRLHVTRLVFFPIQLPPHQHRCNGKYLQKMWPQLS